MPTKPDKPPTPKPAPAPPTDPATAPAKARAPRARAADGSRGVHVAIETLVLTDETADALAFAKNGAIPGDRREVAAAARESVQYLVDKALEAPLKKAVADLRKHRHDEAVKIAEQEANEANRKLEALRAAKVAGEPLDAEKAASELAALEDAKPASEPASGSPGAQGGEVAG